MTLRLDRIAVIAAVVLAVAGLGGGGWWWYSAEQRKVLNAWAQIETRLITARGPQSTPEQRTAAVAEVEQFLAVHRSSSVASLAAYDLGNLRSSGGQYAPARVAYELALARGAGPTVRTLARSELAASWEAERDFGRAADLYQALLADLKPGDFLFEQTLLDVARAQMSAGRRDQAVETYRRFLKDAPGSPRTDEVRMRLATLAASK